jgi:hypothetical protein
MSNLGMLEKLSATLRKKGPQYGLRHLENGLKLGAAG